MYKQNWEKNAEKSMPSPQHPTTLSSTSKYIDQYVHKVYAEFSQCMQGEAEVTGY